MIIGLGCGARIAGHGGSTSGSGGTTGSTSGNCGGASGGASGNGGGIAAAPAAPLFRPEACSREASSLAWPFEQVLARFRFGTSGRGIGAR